MVEEARANLIEALKLFFACADAAEIGGRFRPEVLITQVEVTVPRFAGPVRDDVCQFAVKR